MAVTLADCDRMIEACRAAGVLLTVNHVTRYRRSPGTAKQLLLDGKIGDLRMVRVLSSVIGYLPDDHGWARTPARAAPGSTWASTCSMPCAGSPIPRSSVIFAQIRDFGGLEHQRRSAMAEVVMRSGVIAQLLVSMEMPEPGLGSQSQWTLDRQRRDHRVGLVREGPARAGATAGRRSTRCRRSPSTPTSTARSGSRRSPRRSQGFAQAIEAGGGTAARRRGRARRGRDRRGGGALVRQRARPCACRSAPS